MKFTSLITILCCFPIFLQGQSTIDFDGLFAPSAFALQTTPTDNYSDGFVTFSGDWEVLDCTAGIFGLTGFSAPNALKWNTFAPLTGNVESINFPSPVSDVSFNIGFGLDGNITVESFDAGGTSIDLQSLNVLGTSLVPVTVAKANISRIDITVHPSNSAGCLDDLTYTATTIPTLSQWGIIILALGFLIMGTTALGQRSRSTALVE